MRERETDIEVIFRHKDFWRPVLAMGVVFILIFGFVSRCDRTPYLQVDYLGCYAMPNAAPVRLSTAGFEIMGEINPVPFSIHPSKSGASIVVPITVSISRSSQGYQFAVDRSARAGRIVQAGFEGPHFHLFKPISRVTHLFIGEPNNEYRFDLVGDNICTNWRAIGGRLVEGAIPPLRPANRGTV